MNWFGSERDAAIARRFGTRPRARAATGGALRIGFVFGPRALRRACGRPVPVVVAGPAGIQRTAKKEFRDAAAIARFLVAELNRSFARARIATRVCVGAVGELVRDEARPHGPHPGAWVADLCDGRIEVDGRALPLECWCARVGVNCALVLVDWAMSRTGIEHGGWAGFAPRGPSRMGGELRFHPVAIADLRCALTAHSAAHEFGHLLGCSHQDVVNALAPRARGFVARGEATFSLMAGARRNECGRRLEWSRPAPRGGTWAFGDADHDEAAWLRHALPLLVRQQFRCTGVCAGACADVASRSDGG
ncbi:MAG TPA: hypothetical protein VLW55_05455 [Burkholderiaceae bacterium]|nr:hypothetical protein [Burkholderiaceae bacterium]